MTRPWIVKDHRDEDGLGGVVLRVRLENEACAEFEAFVPVALDEGLRDAPMFERLGADGPLNCTHDLDEATPAVLGSVKWDGCSHVFFGSKASENAPPDGYLHLCGRSEFERLKMALSYAWRECRELLVGTGRWCSATAED